MSTRICLLGLTIGLCFIGRTHAEPRVTRIIDDEINAKLRADSIVSAGRADESTLVRRIYLDLLGRPPTTSEFEAFVDDSAGDKVHRLIVRLRTYPETVVHWRRVIAGWFQVEANRSANHPLLEYLARAVGENRGWDWIARDLLNPNLKVPRQRGASSYLSHFLIAEDKQAGREAATVAVASALFGAQLQCARCHDHPTVPKWTKAHFDGLRAFFDNTEIWGSKLDATTELTERPPKSKTQTQAMFLDGKKFDLADSPRAKLANYVSRPDATHLKYAVVNRVWKQLMGRGLVEPVDMIHDENPSSHPKLFRYLADDFAANEFNFDRLISSIMHSEAYLRSARWTGPADQRPAYSTYAIARLRPLSGHQVAWSIAVSTEYMQRIRFDPRTEGFDLPRGKGLWPAFRYKWEASEEYQRLADVFRETGAASSAAHATYLSFDPFVTKVLESANGSLVANLVAEKDDTAMARLAYFAILNRSPNSNEIEVISKFMKSAKSRTEGCQDIVWALMSLAEFRFNH